MDVKTLVLIDSKNLCFRAHFVHRFLSSRGRCTSILYGVPKMLVAAASKIPNAAFVFVWDGKGKTWRHEITNGFYKGHRQEPNPDMEPAFPQIPVFRNAFEGAGFRHFDFDCLECDDLIGILATEVIKKNLFERVLIYSTDKDFYQLASQRIGIVRGYDKDNQMQVMHEKEVFQEMGVVPADCTKVKALTGEPTDNIPKIATGLGPKTAIKMLAAGLNPEVEEFKKLPWAVRQNFQVFSSLWPKVSLNYKLAKIVTSAEDENLSEQLRTELVSLVNELSKEKFLRSKKCLSDDCFQAFTEFIVEYEMQDLFSSRHELWRMP